MLYLTEVARIGWRAARITTERRVTGGGEQTLGAGDAFVARPVVAGDTARIRAFAGNAQLRFSLFPCCGWRVIVSGVTELRRAGHHAC